MDDIPSSLPRAASGRQAQSRQRGANRRISFPGRQAIALRMQHANSPIASALRRREATARGDSRPVRESELPLGAGRIRAGFACDPAVGFGMGCIAGRAGRRAGSPFGGLPTSWLDGGVGKLDAAKLGKPIMSRKRLNSADNDRNLLDFPDSFSFLTRGFNLSEMPGRGTPPGKKAASTWKPRYRIDRPMLATVAGHAEFAPSARSRPEFLAQVPQIDAEGRKPSGREPISRPDGDSRRRERLTPPRYATPPAAPPRRRCRGA